MRCQGGKMRIQARLLLSQESFSLEKKPTIWLRGCCGELWWSSVVVEEGGGVWTRRK